MLNNYPDGVTEEDIDKFWGDYYDNKEDEEDERLRRADEDYDAMIEEG